MDDRFGHWATAERAHKWAPRVVRAAAGDPPNPTQPADSKPGPPPHSVHSIHVARDTETHLEAAVSKRPQRCLQAPGNFRKSLRVGGAARHVARAKPLHLQEPHAVFRGW